MGGARLGCCMKAGECGKLPTSCKLADTTNLPSRIQCIRARVSGCSEPLGSTTPVFPLSIGSGKSLLRSTCTVLLKSSHNLADLAASTQVTCFSVGWKISVQIHRQVLPVHLDMAKVTVMTSAPYRW